MSIQFKLYFLSILRYGSKIDGPNTVDGQASHTIKYLAVYQGTEMTLILTNLDQTITILIYFQET